MSTEKEAESAEPQNLPFEAPPAVLPVATWHARSRSLVGDTTRVILPIAFLLHFLITGTVVLVYSLYLQQQIPQNYSIGAAIAFGILMTMILTGHLVLYCRKRFDHGRYAERRPRSESERTNGTGGIRKWVQAVKKYLADYENKSHDGFRGFHERRHGQSYAKATKTDLLLSLDRKMDSLNTKLDARLSKLLTTVGARTSSALPSVAALPEPPLQQNPETERELSKLGATELCAISEKEPPRSKAGPVRAATYHGPNDVKQSFEMDASASSNLPPVPLLPPKVARKEVPNSPVRPTVTNASVTLPSRNASDAVPSTIIHQMAAVNSGVKKTSVIPPNDQLRHRCSPGTVQELVVLPQTERNSAAPNPVSEAAPEKTREFQAFSDLRHKRSRASYHRNERSGRISPGQIKAATRHRLDQQTLTNNHPGQPSYQPYREIPNLHHRQSTATNASGISDFSDVSPNLPSANEMSYDDGDVSPIREGASITQPIELSAIKIAPERRRAAQMDTPIANMFLQNPQASVGQASGHGCAFGGPNERLGTAAPRTRIPIATGKPLFTLHGTTNRSRNQSLIPDTASQLNKFSTLATTSRAHSEIPAPGPWGLSNTSLEKYWHHLNTLHPNRAECEELFVWFLSDPVGYLEKFGAGVDVESVLEWLSDLGSGD